MRNCEKFIRILQGTNSAAANIRQGWKTLSDYLLSLRTDNALEDLHRKVTQEALSLGIDVSSSDNKRSRKISKRLEDCPETAHIYDSRKTADIEWHSSLALTGW